MDRRIEIAIDIIEREIGRNLPIRELGQRVCLSTWHFTRLFKSEIGFSPKQFMQRRKMIRAEEMLDHSFLSVKEISADLGFGDCSHFSREFRKFHGASPSQLRQRNCLRNRTARLAAK